jgi:dihydroorotate dehydrogenase (NAD+) catalytic subunit
MSPVQTAVRLGRLELPNPVMVASGTFGFGQEYAGLMDVDALGAIVTKGVSLQERLGNAAPRTTETPCGMLNAIGLQNPGIDGFLADKMPFLRTVAAKVIVNILGDTVEDYAQLAERLDPVDGIDALEVNISCPNVKQGGIAFGSNPDAAREVAAAVRAATGLPVLVKLSPNVTDLVAIARAVAETGVDGLTLINTLRGMSIDYRTGRPKLGNLIGGLSGPAIRPVAVRAVFEVTRLVDIPVVGCGGIVEWPDAVEFLRAGASAIQVGSATFRDPRAANKILEGLVDFVARIGGSDCQELVGAVDLQGEGPEGSR